mmetsp:Transcript_26663/g.88517  ORF Transcript_26663/g.88517 Transcript_26663/m.88517 type:complete len:202 (-) Transcript_26663:25-630(-)
MPPPLRHVTVNASYCWTLGKYLSANFSMPTLARSRLSRPSLCKLSSKVRIRSRSFSCSSLEISRLAMRARSASSAPCCTGRGGPAPTSPSPLWGSTSESALPLGSGPAAVIGDAVRNRAAAETTHICGGGAEGVPAAPMESRSGGAPPLQALPTIEARGDCARPTRGDPWEVHPGEGNHGAESERGLNEGWPCDGSNCCCF